MDSHLLPDADASPLCSVFTRGLGVRPAGTGLSLDRVLLVTVPTPWPKPALGHDWLKPAAQALTRSAIRSRLFAAEPWGDGIEIELFERSGLRWQSYRWSVESPGEIESVVATIAEAAPQSHGMAPIDVTVPTFLVCTQGSHDVCCGVDGERLSTSIEQERPAYRLRRVSHTGGHRFAPTFLALPSGRMWAYADLALVDRVASDSVTADDLRMYCRGWLGAPGGAAQVAEIAARVAAANPFVESPTIDVELRDERSLCTVAVDGRTAIVDVRPGRTLPSIACEKPGGLPAKTSVELDWTMLEDPWN